VPETPFHPQHTFTDFGLLDLLLSNVTQRGYTTPTPIQDQAIPLLISGRDVVGIADTGTGKTAAFLLPLIQKLLNNPQERALIMAPTRELAIQIVEEFRAFGQNLPLKTAVCIGGLNINNQIRRLQEQPQFVIGTPGRIKDLVQRHKLKMATFTNIVLDEVDRMLDIGFRQDILFLIGQLPRERQAAFFSATINGKVEEIMRQLMNNPVMVKVRQQATTLQIHQDIVTIKPGQNKVDVLHQLLSQEEFARVIVFNRTKRGVTKLERQLFDRGFKVSALHGNKSQSARQRSLQEFKTGQVQALLATDIVARGIDVDDVTHVINFDEPMTYDDYIHRIGRTGRAGKIGTALTFVS
jgi:superfamily II DNA/RNA helicase